MNGHEHLQAAMQQMPPRIGERLCLDFLNTIEPRGTPALVSPLSEQQRAAQREYLTNYSDFLAWGILVGIMKEEAALHLLEQAMSRPSEADETLKQIIVLRERLYAMFWSIAFSRPVQESELAWLHQVYLDVLSYARLANSEERYVWQWTVDKEHLASPIWPVIQSALELLTTEDLTRLKVCPGTPGAPMACAWLFYDESKNRSRHWCSMSDCGSRTKALRLTERRRMKRKQHKP